MGGFASTIINGVQGVANSITAAVTDAATTVAQLTDISKQFTPPAIHKYMFVDGGGGAMNVNKALTDAMSGAKTAATSLFKSSYPNDTPNGDDCGVVQNYQSGGNVQTVVNQLSTCFTKYNIVVDSATINNMAASIQSDVDAQMGQPGSTAGVHYINQAQYIDWTVSYGIFDIADGNKGLVYGFCVAFNSGW